MLQLSQMHPQCWHQRPLRKLAVRRSIADAMRRKEEANVLFKAGKYEEAELMYQKGLEALESGMPMPSLLGVIMHTGE